MGYVYLFFFQIIQRLHLFKGLPLIRTLEQTNKLGMHTPSERIWTLCIVAAASSPLRTFLANGKNCPSLGPLTITWHCIGSANHWPHFSLAQPKIDWCNSRNSTILHNTVTIKLGYSAKATKFLWSSQSSQNFNCNILAKDCDTFFHYEW